MKRDTNLEDFVVWSIGIFVIATLSCFTIGFVALTVKFVGWLF